MIIIKKMKKIKNRRLINLKLNENKKDDYYEKNEE